MSEGSDAGDVSPPTAYGELRPPDGAAGKLRYEIGKIVDSSTPLTTGCRMMPAAHKSAPPQAGKLRRINVDCRLKEKSRVSGYQKIPQQKTS